MHDYLFSQDSLILPTLLAAVFCYLFFRSYQRFWTHKRRLAIVLLGTIGLFVAEILIIRQLFGLDDTPAASYYMAFVLDGLLLTTLAFPSYSWRHWFYGGAAMLSTALLIALTINNFYQYYPTLSAVFKNHYTKSDQSVTTNNQISRQHLPIVTLESRFFTGGVSQGTLTQVNIPGTVSGFDARDGYVYLPPAYQDKSLSDTPFPVLVLLTGTPGTPTGWLQSGIFVNIMNNFAAHHAGITPIVAIVDHSGSFTNDTECLNSSHGNAETYVTNDVPAYLRAHYRVSANPSNWGIGGYSEGGFCAGMLTLTHPDLFMHFLDMSGYAAPYLTPASQTLPVLFNGSRVAAEHHNMNWILTHERLNPNITAQFAIGSEDTVSSISGLRYTYHLASKRHLTSSLEVAQDQGHNFTFWSQAFTNALPNLSYYLGATECQTDCY